MTDEGQTKMDMVELLHAIKGMAEATRKFYMDLRDEGFTEEQAMKLTASWVRAITNQNRND